MKAANHAAFFISPLHIKDNYLATISHNPA